MSATLRHSDEWLDVWQGDNREAMRLMSEKSVHAIVTSPPYWGLRDYGLPPSVWGGDAEHAHEWGSELVSKGPAQAQGETSQRKGRANVDEQVQRDRSNGSYCACGAWLGCLGLEPTPEEYTAHIVEVFREAKRVLRDDGVLWLNLGDSYASSSTYNTTQSLHTENGWKQDSVKRPNPRPSGDIKPKDLVGIPWMAAFALRKDGWYLRQDIVWAKPNPMPESVEDRPTRSHEFIFMLTKSQRYFYDHLSVREPPSEATLRALAARAKDPVEDREYQHDSGTRMGKRSPNRVWSDPEAMARLASGRNLRDVWSIATAPYPGAHYAVFPPKLVEPMVKSSTSEKGSCGECGAPWDRVTGRPCSSCGAFIPTQGKSCPECGFVNDWKADRGLSEEYGTTDWSTAGKGTPRRLNDSGKEATAGLSNAVEKGWERTCAHEAEPRPCVVLDPFGGSGTVAMVAQSLGRRAVLIDLNDDYIGQQMLRNAQMPLTLL